MRNLFLGVVIMACVLTVGLTSSCNDSISSSSGSSNDCAITNMIVGSLTRTMHTINTYGRDTTYTTTVSGSVYPMYIDQYKQEIYNPDSLPLGTHVTKVAFSSISSDGIISYRTDWGTDSLYSTSDSLNFTNPRIFTCYSYSGLEKKVYTVHVNVHQVDPEVFQWGVMTEGNNLLKNITTQRALVKDDKVYVFAISNGQGFVFTSSVNDGATWEGSALNLNNFSPYNVQLFNDRFYALDGNRIISSTNGKDWTLVSNTFTASALMATSSQLIFAAKNDTVYSSSDGITWIADSLNDDAVQLPTGSFSSVCLPMSFNSNFEYVLLGGTQNGINVEWKKIIDTEGNNSEAWCLYNFDSEMNHPYPSTKDLQMIKYDSRVLALGSDGDTLSLFYLSRDGGRTWIPQTKSYVHPSAISATNFSCVVDKDNYIWIICGGSGNVYRGRLNRLGFKSNQTSFTE